MQTDDEATVGGAKESESIFHSRKHVQWKEPPGTDIINSCNGQAKVFFNGRQLVEPNIWQGKAQYVCVKIYTYILF